MPAVIFLLPDGERRRVEVEVGQSLLEAAYRGGIAVEGACGGSMACATCHMIVEDAWFDRLALPSEEEEEMLDLAEGPTPTSRLGCQVRMSPELDGLVVRIPPQVLLE
ncbi:MAG TPA: 2Fe-2S iron-sulfur cluster binding domain-containing protein [Rhodospirillales bacterium]|nr:2Fe-2S iron-sulfur cluster binding domain-containing protein [Rhodospirillales bacterium]